MKNILVPTDFSKLSENSLKLATNIAEKAGGEIFLINFVNHPFGATFSTMGEMKSGFSEEERFTLELVKKNQERLGALSDKYGDNVTINFQVYDEDYDDGIVKYIEEQDIDLVVMGTSGEESTKEFFTGNHTDKMIKTAKCPVISVKEESHIIGFDHIVVGVDLEHDDDDNYPKAARLLNEFSTIVGGHLHMVHVADTNANKHEVKAGIDAFIDKHNFNDFSVAVTQNDDKEQGLLAYAHSTGASLIVILTHTEKGFFNFFTASMAEDISKSALIPVMAINLNNI